ncbi:MAG: CDP-alcohol phosphatidyltransferase family protein, partial [Desulfuromonadaceae bacterium]
VIAAGFLFHYGYYATGLIAAWGMTFLDTVDGKLARVTVNSSQLGNIYDHGIDLISPPFWYLLWALSLPTVVPGCELPITLLIYVFFIGYIGGRLCEGIFKKWLEPSGIFCWQPIDSYFRLITGRRNPNLILLTISLFTGTPDLGLLAVAIWTLLSTLFLVARLVMGFQQRRQGMELRSWFLDLDPDTPNPTLAQRCFSNTGR